MLPSPPETASRAGSSTLVLSMDEKGSKQVDVLNVQPAAAAREQIAAAVFEWQLGLHNTMLAGFLPPIKISVEVPLCIVEHQTFPARIVSVFRKGIGQALRRLIPLAMPCMWARSRPPFRGHFQSQRRSPGELDVSARQTHGVMQAEMYFERLRRGSVSKSRHRDRPPGRSCPGFIWLQISNGRPRKTVWLECRCGTPRPPLWDSARP
jgi:hypothetical protein